MKKLATLSLVAFAAFGLAACSKPASESTEVNAVDTNLTAEETVVDTNAAGDSAMMSNDVGMDNAVSNELGADNGMTADNSTM